MKSSRRKVSKTDLVEFFEHKPPRVFRFETSRTPLPDDSYPVLVRRETYQPDTWKHEHVYHEIVLVESGTADHLTAAGIQKLHPGDIVVIKQRVWHAYQNTQNLQIINCLYDRKILQDHGKFISMVDGAFELFVRPPEKSVATPPALFHAQPSQRTQMIENLEAIMAEMDQKKRDWKAMVTVRLLDFLVAISRLSRGESQAGSVRLSSHALEAVERAVEFLEAHYTEDVSLAPLAARLHICPSYLSRMFSRRMGMGIVQYLHHLRIDEACRQLRNAETPIGQIAGNVGYNEIAYFSRRFRKETGLSALEYRKKYRGQ